MTFPIGTYFYKSRSAIAIGFALLAASVMVGAVSASLIRAQFDPTLIVVGILVGTYLADVLSAIVHFCFDYVVPEKLPLLGSVATSFRHHHSTPVLDPTQKIANFALGATATLPLALSSLAITVFLPHSSLSSVASIAVGTMAVWGLFFHQIHSYTHMGSHVDAVQFKARVDAIVQTSSTNTRQHQLNMVFDELPIPRAIRLLQRVGLLLDPVKHVAHHTDIDCNFSSVNGWSDGLMNPILRRLARRFHHDVQPDQSSDANNVSSAF